MEVLKCKLCMEVFENELNLILHFKQSHLDSDYVEDDSLASDTSDSEEVSEDESEQCEYNDLMSFLTDYEEHLLHSACSMAEEEGFLNVDESSVPSSNDRIKDAKGNHQDQLDPNSFITDYEWRLLESSSSRAEAEGIVEVDEKLLEEGKNCSQSSASHNEENAEIDEAPVSSNGARRKLPVRRCKQVIPGQRSPVEKVRQLLRNLKPTRRLESDAETESGKKDDDGAENEEDKFKCNHKGCGKCFTWKSDLNRHEKIHKVKPHMCAICRQNFAKPHLLEAHMLTHKGGAALLECEVCHKRFSKLRTLQIHRNIHAKSNPHVCSQCQKAFTRKSHLDVHVKAHKSKPYMCTLCKQNFVRPQYLEAHMLIKHKAEGAKVKHPFECKCCHKRFSNKRSLQLHVTTHARSNPHVCNQCKKVFSQKGHLEDHIMRKHSESRGVQCDLCDHWIGTNKDLVRHKKVHNKLCFPCKMCDKKFIRKIHLKSHTLSSHVKEREGKFGCQKCNKLFLKEDALVAHIIEAHKEP